MKYIKLIFSLVVTILFIWALDKSWNLGDGKEELFIPPLGKLLAPSHGFWQNAEGEIPSFDATIDASLLSAPVEVLYDDRMVPHIFASNMEDAAFAQGYTTASLRLWQMELQTHAAAGRLTEIFGTTERLRKILIGRDKETRRIGLPLGAERAIELWKELPEYQIIEAYANGINAYINSMSYADLPLMYKLQDYRPEAWTTLKTALLLKNMGRTLTSRDHDFGMTNALKHLGLETFNKLYPDYFEEQSPIILDSMNYIKPIAVSEANPINLYLGETGTDSLNKEMPPKGVGSNNWAVAASKTKNGNPILCNDPHLVLNLPSIWFEVQLHTPEVNTYGASLPGAPGVISGFNDYIAWGVTNVSHDVRDWYAIQWKDDTKQEYWFDSTYRKAEMRLETIKVRGGDDIIDTLILTHIGPIAHSADGQDFALRWTLHDASEEAVTFIKLNKAKNYADYKDAIKHFSCPAQNIIFADKNGDIALWTQGKLPLRKQNQGKFVQQGTSSSELWQGYIPQEHIPHEYNPAKNFVGSANQHSVDPNTYPYAYYGYFEEYRGRYLNRKLTEMDSITVQDMMDLQYDAYSVKAEDFMGLLKKHLQTGRIKKEELEVWYLLKSWNNIYGKDQIEPTIFENWLDTLQQLVYDELTTIQQSKPKFLNNELMLPNDYQLLALLKRDTANTIIDIAATAEHETIQDLITISFQRSCTTIPRDSSGNIQKWMERRNASIDHISRVAAFGTKTVPSDGHGSTLNAQEASPGPSWRMVVELGKEINAHGIYPGGQSENPGSRYYNNMIEKWAKGEHYKLLFMKDKTVSADRIVFKQGFEQ